MERAIFSKAAEVEQAHWWFKGRRAILSAVLDRYIGFKSDREILEIGCGNGGNLSLLTSYGRVWAVEIDDTARARASERNLGEIERGWLPDGIPFQDRLFDVVAALDVLEHIQDDAAAMRTIAARLGPRGLLVMTAPAYSWLWSSHDIVSHHKRRYCRRELLALVKGYGLEPIYSGYFNTFLFPFAVAGLTLGRLLKSAPKGLSIPPLPVNNFLCSILSSERRLIPTVSLPFGLSIIVCARRAQPPGGVRR